MATRRRIDGDALLRALAVGGCTAPATKAPVEVIVREAAADDSACCTDATNSTTLDASKFDQEDCPSLIYTITNNSPETQVLVIGGGPGMAGDYTIYGQDPNASDEPLVVAEDGESSAPEPNVIPLQFLAMKGKVGGIVITGINVEPSGEAAVVASQSSQRLQRVSMGLDRSVCRRKRVKNICNVECGDSETDILQYDVCILTDTDHWLELPIVPEATIELEVFYAGFGADVHNIRSCNGKVMSAVAA